MKKDVVMDILDIIFIPLITYLLSGFLLIQLCGLSVDVTGYAVWGVMAGIVLGIQKWFSNKAITTGIVIYALAMILWFAIFVESEGIQHALLICISFVVILVLRFVMRHRIVKIVTGYGIMGIMIYFSIMDVEFSKILIGFAIILFLSAVSETIALFYSGNVKSLIVIYVMVAVITLVMPVSDKPYGWNFVFKIIDSIEQVVDRIVTEINYQLSDTKFSGVFRFGNTGYSSSEMNLSNSLLEQDVEQLVLQGSYTKRNLYLKGNICNEYVGNSWKTSLNNETLDYRVDALMTLYAIFQETEDMGELSKFMEIKEQKIIQQNIKTQSLFYPVKILAISVEDTISVGDMIRATQVNGRGYSYTYTFLDIDYANKQLINILKNAANMIYKEEDYNRIYTNLKEIYGIEVPVIPFDEFCVMAEKAGEMAREQYNNQGGHISENVRSLAEEITKNHQGTYEISKALEKYLYQYNYNKIIQVPEGVNVLDWFLFEGKEGYCAHYATALAMMLRCEGVPSRIAEGFLVDYKERIDSYTYSISSDVAHVWVEAYIDGFGWIRLEPTVVNAGNANAVWYSEAAYEEEEILEETIEEIITESEEEQQKMSWILMLQLLGGMIVIVIIILTGLYVCKRISIKKSNNPDIVFGHMISVLEKKYFARIQSETLSEYFKRLEDEGDIEKDILSSLIEIQKVMEIYWYGDGTVSQEIIAGMKGISSM